MNLSPDGPREFGLNGYTLAQVPNVPLIIALIGVLAGRLFNAGSTGYYIARGCFYIGLTVWAWLELTDGVNGFRRVLGAAGLAWALYLLQEELSR